MNKPLLIFSAPVETRSGYGEHSRDIFASLLKMDRFDIKILSQRWGSTSMNALDDSITLHKEIKNRILLNNNQLPRQPEVWVQVTVPNEFQPMGKYNIGITAGIETTACHQEWLQGVNRMNLVIVPSQFSKKVFTDTKYDMVDDKTKVNSGELIAKSPIEVIFEGADTSIYYQTDNIILSVRHELNKIKEDFCYLFVGHWLKGKLGHDRKDVGMLIKVFLETFKREVNPPALILKTSGATFSIIDREEILKKIEEIKKTITPDKSMPNIHLLHGELSAEEMNGLYNHSKVKAHVSFTKGEGFGRPLLEASLSGKPVIVSNWSGHLDFLKQECNLMIGGQLKNVDESAAWDKVIMKESQWFNIDYNQAANAMNSVFKDYKGAKAFCSKQLNISKQNFSLNKMHDKFKEVFDKYIPEFPKQMELKLPKLNKIELPKLNKIELPKLKKLAVDNLEAPQEPKKEEINELSKM